MKMTALRILFAAGLALAIASPRSLLQDLQGIPERCLNAGLTMQTACSKEIDEGSAYFGVEPGNDEEVQALANQEAEIKAYLDKANPPNPACCSAAQDFNEQKCSCDPAMLQVVSGFTGGSTQLYETIAKYFAKSCNFPPYVGSTC